MTDVASAEAAATTNWRSYDGSVLPGFKFHVIFFPVLLGLFLVLPVMLCYCCLSRGRIVPYTPPNYMGGDLTDKKGPYNGSVHHAYVSEK